MIPVEAVEAAARVIAGEVWRTAHSRDVVPIDLARVALEAAAPYMQTSTNQENTMTVEQLEQDIRDIPVTVISGPPVDLSGVLAKHLHDLGYRKTTL